MSPTGEMSLSHTHRHTHTHTCVCGVSVCVAVCVPVCVCMFVCLHVSYVCVQCHMYSMCRCASVHTSSMKFLHSSDPICWKCIKEMMLFVPPTGALWFSHC